MLQEKVYRAHADAFKAECKLQHFSPSAAYQDNLLGMHTSVRLKILSSSSSEGSELVIQHLHNVVSYLL